jgi:hypothetical protein
VEDLSGADAAAAATDSSVQQPPPVEPEPATGCSSAAGGSLAGLGVLLGAVAARASPARLSR